MIETDAIKGGQPDATARLIGASKASNQEEALERALRPKRLADYVGQQKIRDQLEIFIQAARKRGEALDHVLLFGPPGLGKTTLAHIVAAEMGVNLRPRPLTGCRRPWPSAASARSAARSMPSPCARGACAAGSPAG